MSGEDNSDSLDDALIRREPQSFVRAPFSNAGAVRVEEAQRNNAASRTPTAVLNVISSLDAEENMDCAEYGSNRPTDPPPEPGPAPAPAPELIAYTGEPLG